MTDPKPLTPEEEPFLRDRVYAVLHAHECDETPAEHSWREHLPWDSEDDALASERLADALIVAILKPSAAFPDGIPLPSSLLVSTAPIATDEIALPLTPFEEAGLRVAAAVDTADSELTYIGEVKRLLATLDAERAARPDGHEHHPDTRSDHAHCVDCGEAFSVDFASPAPAPDAERLRKALVAVRDMEPEPVEVEIPDHSDCEECARYRAMPPHTLPGGFRVCDGLYRALARRDREYENARQAQQWRMREIARAALAAAGGGEAGE